ncbi:hypothetical protein U1Q18_033564 [Sarracenia purpurea var. burkii]
MASFKDRAGALKTSRTYLWWRDYKQSKRKKWFFCAVDFDSVQAVAHDLVIRWIDFAHTQRRDFVGFEVGTSFCLIEDWICLDCVRRDYRTRRVLIFATVIWAKSPATDYTAQNDDALFSVDRFSFRLGTRKLRNIVGKEGFSGEAVFDNFSGDIFAQSKRRKRQ